MRPRTAFVVIGLLGPLAALADDGPLSPAEAAKTVRLEPGLGLELVAAEPLVASPVALAFDERGRLFVAENRGYPTGPGEGKPPIGRIAMLEDIDGDGRMDRRTDFAEGLTFPNGVMPWKGGLIVTCAPDALYLKDTDGDGRADERTVLFTGFSTSGSTQLRVSHPTLSIDNWVYVTSGLTGGKVTNPAFPDRPPIELKRNDFRFQPDMSEWEAVDGGSQFGLTFDDFGQRFICYNRVQVQHVVIDSKTLRRNPNLAFSETVQNCPVDMVAEPLKGHGASARLYPISSNITTADSHAGTFTAACAVFVWRGTGLPERYRGGVFSCDPTGNLVHFDLLEPDGATFRAQRATEGVEFLASTDNWFRPVFLASGPDGALYVVDMYRKTIEHPDYLPVEVRKHTDFESGKDTGRIWRVVRDDLQGRSARPSVLAGASTWELCGALRSADGWRRDTAHRLLLERRDPSAVARLEVLAMGADASPEAIVQAAWLLDAQRSLKDDVIEGLMKRPDLRVREVGAQLAGGRTRSDPRWVSRLLPLADDPDARVRFATSIALGEAERAETEGAITRALARMASRDAADRWARAAVFSGLAGRERPFLSALVEALPPDPGDAQLDLLGELGRLMVAGTARAIWPSLIQLVMADHLEGRHTTRAALLAGMAEGARAKRGAREATSPLEALLGERPDPAQAAAVDAIVAKMTAVAKQDADHRSLAIGLLACAPFDRAAPVLLDLLDRGQADADQVVIVRSIGKFSEDRVVAELLDPERFARYTPMVREEVLSALFSQTGRLPDLMTALEEGRLPLVSIDALRRRQLTQTRDQVLRERANRLFGAVAGDRAAVYESYKDVVQLKADPSNGRGVFRRECASCHRLDREGSAVGPDLFGIRNQPKEAILLHVLVPDQEITQGFTAYTVSTKDGRVLTGLIVSESPAGVTLRLPQGKEEVLARAAVDEVQASPQSLMPQGLEKTISRQEFADLLAYLKGEGGP
jgi:putative membrane-bound dehydrogenase-like protein